MEQESPDEFVGGQAHRFGVAAIPIVLPLKAHLIVVDVEEAVIADGHPMGIAAHVVKNLLRPGEGPLGIDHPLRSLRAGQKLSESLAFAKRFQVGEEVQLACVESRRVGGLTFDVALPPDQEVRKVVRLLTRKLADTRYA